MSDPRGENPRDPHISLDSHESLFKALSERYFVVALSDDQRQPDNAAFGRIATVGKRKVTLRGIDRAGLWTGERDHLYKDIGVIMFAGGYETALASVVQIDAASSSLG